MNTLLNDFISLTPSYSVFVEYSLKKPSTRSLKDIFLFSKKELNDYGKSFSSFNSGDSDINKYLIKMSWGIRSYISIQDVFDYSVKEIPENSKELFDGHNYCYFESLVYLRQITWNIVNANSLSAICLLRPFLELSIYNIYWDLQKDNNPNKNVLSWLKGDIGKPPIKNTLIWISDYLQKNYRRIAALLFNH
jgi:hypothetical protein